MCPHSQFAGAPGALPDFNLAALAQLDAMGFLLVRCQKALLATGNSDPEATMGWFFAHMGDPGTPPSQARNGHAERERWWLGRSGAEYGASGHVGRDGLFACASARDGA